MRKTMILLCVAVALVASSAMAQSADVETKKEIQLTRQIIQTERQALVTQSMHLTAEENEAFWPLYRDWRANRSGRGRSQVT